jgi:hypothetical protein
MGDNFNMNLIIFYFAEIFLTLLKISKIQIAGNKNQTLA